ncbi:hypothetical protein RB653_000171 [Dictyostelium firmibasis]|uniref:Uncharacterized protein n=1 Tax=Dictyostelium firmibasis TaxID=79012 RepID=A0AAN7UF01_9MYCE
MKMETINYFKIKYMIESILVTELKDELYNLISANVLSIPSNVHSRNKYETLYKKNDPEGYKTLTKAEKSLLEIGIDENFSFKLISNLISNMKLIPIFKDQIDNVKDITQYLNLNFDSIKDFKLNNKKFEEIRKRIITFLEKTGRDVNDDIKITDKINSNSTDDFWFMEEIKENVYKLKDIGNKFYSKGEFDKAIKSYLEAFVLSGLSDSMKGILFLNISTCYLAKVNSKQKIRFVETEYPLSIHEALRYSILSLSKRPNWFKPYYRIGQILSKFSKFEKSIQFLNASLSLEDSSETQILIEETNEKLKSLMDCKNNGERNFEKESMLRIEKLGTIHLNQFKETITDKFFNLIKKQTVKSFEKYLEDSKSFGLSEKHLIERFVSDVVRLINFPNLDLQSEAFSRCIGNKTQYAQPYFEFANSLIPPNPKDIDTRNNHLIIGLMLYASTLPVKFDLICNKNDNNDNNDNGNNNFSESFNIHNFNGGVLRAQEFLGHVYRLGLFGEDIDLEKSIYYFNKSIENSQGIEINYLHISGYECIGPLTLSDMYHHGDTPNGINDTEKAAKLYQLFKVTNNNLMQLIEIYEGSRENDKQELKLEKESDRLYYNYLFLKTDN